MVKRAACKKKKLIEESQEQITHQRIDRFTGKEITVLVEEAVEGEDLFIGRGYLHAPEVEGLVVLRAENLLPCQMVKAVITRRNGMDLEGQIRDASNSSVRV